MNRKLILALPLLIAGMLALGGSAHATCPIDNPGCGPGDPPTTTTLHVVDSTQATVTATGSTAAWPQRLRRELHVRVRRRPPVGHSDRDRGPGGLYRAALQVHDDGHREHVAAVRACAVSAPAR
jgi:hypothetical protein